MSVEHISFEVLILVVVVVIGLFIIVRSFSLPRNFSANQEQREELRKKLMEENTQRSRRGEDTGQEEEPPQ